MDIVRELGVQTRGRYNKGNMRHTIYGKYTILMESIRIVKVNLYKLAMKMNILRLFRKKRELTASLRRWGRK